MRQRNCAACHDRITAFGRKCTEALRDLRDVIVRSSADAKGNVLWVMRSLPRQQEVPASINRRGFQLTLALPYREALLS